MQDSLSSKYSPQEIEEKWYAKWEENNYFKPNGVGDSYCIVIPPPNITGSLHMGHGFQHTIMDALIRYHRMRGLKSLWQPGTDHAGIATQMIVEKRLLEKGIHKEDLGREKFIDKIWDWKNHSGNNISKQIRRLGASLDWSRDKFTLDQDMSDAVQNTFIQLYREKLIYRGKRLVNWDPALGTAISDLEVNNEEVHGKIWEIKYPFVDSNDGVIIATTRPETLFGDVAIAVNPDDQRYQQYIGKKVCLPLTNRQLPIIADSQVDQEFGTGCVKITPAHDFNDYIIGKRHNLEQINILTKEAKLNSIVPNEFQNLDCQRARKLVVQQLDNQGLITKTSDHIHMVPKGDRSGVVIEPFLTEQWFVNIKPLAKPAIDAVKTEQIIFIPKNWENTYYQWMNNIEDWCISRQLWWGHRIPAWYDEAGNIYVGKNQEDIMSHYNLPDDISLTQDPDVLDTWFSSALWPFSTLGWPNNTKELKEFFPTDVLVTGFDIIFFWVARMIMFSLKFTNTIPFKKIYITGLIRDSHGQKMSKSKGNILDPIDIIDGIELQALLDKRTSNLMQPEMQASIKAHTLTDFPNGIKAHGTDALRFNFCALASTGRDIKFDMDRLLGYRNLCNKLWNATRFVLLQCEKNDYSIEPEASNLSDSDIWINSKLQKLIKNTHHYYEVFRFDLMAQELHEFIWQDFCSWYIEIAKHDIANQDSSADRRYTIQYILLTTLEKIVCLMHPITPFITEEIWQNLSAKLGLTEKSIMLRKFPIYQENLLNEEKENELKWLQGFIDGIRNIRGENNIASKKEIEIVIIINDPAKITINKERLNKNKFLLTKLVNVKAIDFRNDASNSKNTVTFIFDYMEVHISLDGVIDIEAEELRIKHRRKKLEKEKEKLSYKLNETDFKNKAPQDIVVKEQARLTDIENQLEKIDI